MKPCLLILALLAMFTPLSPAVAQPPTTLTLTFSDEVPTRGTVQGRVFEDMNRNGSFDADIDRPVPGALVSDGIDVVQSESDGVYQFQVAESAQTIFITPPASFRAVGTFYQFVRSELEANSGATYNFALEKAPAVPPTFSFAQISDVQAANPADLQRLSHALDEVMGSNPKPQFIVATGDHVDSATRTSLFEGVAAVYRRNAAPIYSVPGTYDLQPPPAPLAAYRNAFGPDYYSVNLGDWHFVFLNSTTTQPHQTRWLKKNLAAVGRDKKLVAYQYHVPSSNQVAQLQQLGFRAIFSGQWHGTRLELDKRGLATITQGPLLMGGLDATPASFRIITISGDQLNTELRVLNTDKVATIVCPDEFMNGGRRLLVNLMNSKGGEVREARFRLQVPGAPPFAEGNLVQVSPTAWMAPLDARVGVPETLPPSFQIRVRATSHDADQWDTSRAIRQGQPAAPVRTGEDWPMFMGTAQRTGRATSNLPPPLRLAWVAPTHGTIGLGSPVFYKGKLAIGGRDTDNLLNNGVAIFDSVSGKRNHFIKSDSMVNHSPAFGEDREDGPGALWASSAAGEVLQISPGSGTMQSAGRIGGSEWIYSAPVAQGRLAVLGNSSLLQAFHAQMAEQRWTHPGTGDWPPSFASPTLAGPMLLMAGNWLTRDKKPASIFGLTAESGALRWSIESTGGSGSVAAAGGRGYFIDNRGTLICFEAETGKPLARKPLDGGWSLSTPALDKDVVIAPGGAGTIYAFNTQTMEQIWTFNAGESLWTLAPFRKDRKAVFSSPTIAGEWVYIGCSDGKLYCLDKRTGAPAWSFDFGVPTLSTPCVTGNTLFTAAMDGNVYAFTGGQP